MNVQWISLVYIVLMEKNKTKHSDHFYDYNDDDYFDNNLLIFER